MTTAEADREIVRTRLAEADRLLTVGDADGANAQTDELTPLTDRWERDGALVDLLSPLLDATEQAYVRFGAASILLSHRHTEVALPALEDVRDNTEGTASLSARSLLSHWKRQNG